MSGTSMVVRQFCAVAFGELPPHSPTQPWRVVRVELEVREYCLACSCVRRCDRLVGEKREIVVCRVCDCEMERSVL
jgi:hypothetical protein